MHVVSPCYEDPGKTPFIQPSGLRLTVFILLSYQYQTDKDHQASPSAMCSYHTPALPRSTYPSPLSRMVNNPDKRPTKRIIAAKAKTAIPTFQYLRVYSAARACLSAPDRRCDGDGRMRHSVRPRCWPCCGEYGGAGSFGPARRTLFNSGRWLSLEPGSGTPTLR
jgi:hypothetical protein